MKEFKSTDVFVKGFIADINYRFIFVRLNHNLEKIATLLELSENAKKILGKTLAGTFLLSSGEVKQEDMIGVQIEIEDKKIYTFANSSGGIRGTIYPAQTNWNSELYSGIMQVNKFRGQSKKVYSSIIDFQNTGIPRLFENYILKSQQINAFLNLYLNTDGFIYGYLFEPLPETSMNQIDFLASLLYKEDMNNFLKSLLETDNDIKKLESKRFFNAKILKIGFLYHYCDCNIKKIEHIFFVTGKEELQKILDEKGQVEIVCEFCKKKYHFTQKDIDHIFKKENL